MIVRIDQTSPHPVYLQIRDQIVGAIAHGELLPADRLPSVRTLASDLGINLHTVNKAYAVLRDEGYLLMRGRSGAIVADYQQVASAERLAAELYQLALEHCAQGGTEDTFLTEARTQAERVFADPGIAGTRRDISALGIDENGNALKDARANSPRKSTSALSATNAQGA